MAVKSQVQVEYAGDLNGGGAPNVINYKEATSQSFKNGQLVYLASGYITACANSATTILGIARKDASGTLGTAIPVEVLTPTSLLSFCVYHATSASAITAQADVGIKRRLVVVSNKNYVDMTAVADTSIVIMELDPRDTVGDIYGRYICTILASALQSCIGA